MANIPVHQASWQGLSQDDKTRITEIMKNAGLIDQGDNLVAHPNPAEAAQQMAEFKFSWPQIPNSICKLGCNAAEAAAVAACASLTGPLAGICSSVAHAAGDFCRSRC